MGTDTAPPKGDSPDLAPALNPDYRPGPLGRLGLWVTGRAKLVTGTCCC